MRACFSRSRLPLGPLRPLGPLLAVAALALPLVAPGALLAQTAAPSGQPASKDAAKDAPGDAPKQIALSQAKIDSLVAAQKKIEEVEAKAQAKAGAKDGAKDQARDQAKGAEADAKPQKEIEGIVTASGFASMKEFSDTMFSIGIVLSGMDPDGKDYIGTVAALKKEEAQVKADKKMPANEKKEVLDEIEAGIKNAPTDKPLPGNIDLVKANMSKLDQSSKAD